MVAETLGFALVDTGLFYRAVTVEARRRGIAAGDVPGLITMLGELRIEINTSPSAGRTGALISIDGRDISREAHDPAIAGELSRISGIPDVRRMLTEPQRHAARSDAVILGRDIGTVIFPDADVKIFVTATPEVRARRRARELREAGDRVNEAEVFADIRGRDERDSQRAVAPLKAAPDAHLLDTTHLDIDAAFRAAIDIVEAVRAGRKRG